MRVILKLPHNLYGVRYWQPSDDNTGFKSLHRTDVGNDAISTACIFIVEKVDGGIVLRNLSTKKYVAASNPANGVDDVADAAVLEAICTNSSNFDSYFGTTAEERLAAVRFKKVGTGNYLNSNGPQWYNGTGVWSANLVHEAVISYPTHYGDRTETLTRTDRYPESFTLTNSDNASVTHPWGKGTKNNYVYVDDSAFEVVVKAGSTFNVSIRYTTGGPMHAYAYIDYDNDGFSAAVAANGGALAGNDLVAFTKYNNKNSLGQNAAGGNFPGFPNGMTAPSAPGKYRMRLKIDWNDIDPKGRPASGTNATLANGGGIIDFTLNVVDELRYHTAVNFVDENDAPIECSYDSQLAVLGGEAGRLPVGACLPYVVDSQTYLSRGIASIAANGTTYGSWADLNAAVNTPATLTVKVLPAAVQPGRYYAFRHAGNTNRYIWDVGTNLQAQADVTPGNNGRYVFRVEAASAGDAAGVTPGMFYLHNVGTGRYVERTGASGIINDQNIPTLAALDPANCAYRITNGLVACRSDIFGIADAIAVANPMTGVGNERYLHCNNSQKVVRWSTSHAERNNSQWYIEEVQLHTIALDFTVEGEPTAAAIDYVTEGYAREFVEGQRLLSCLTGIAVSDHSVKSYSLNGTTYGSKAAFIAACHEVTDDNARATIDLADEVDVTIALWKANGTFYDNGVASSNASAAHAEWRLNALATDAKVSGSCVPVDLDLKITAVSTGAQIGGHINGSSHALYHYGQASTAGPDGLTFKAAPLVSGADNQPYEYRMSVDDKYYILQYEIGFIPNSVDYPQLITNDGGGRVLTAKPNDKATKYTITDTPAGNATSFYVKVKKEGPTAAQITTSGNQPNMAVFFQVRIVNRKYLEEHQQKGVDIVVDALAGNVGYPLGEEEVDEDHTDVRKALRLALEAYNGAAPGEARLAAYCHMLQAYSRFISCRHLQMPEDNNVYNVSFIDLNGDKHLVAQNPYGLELIDYNAKNCAKKEARWISHEANGKLVFVNKATGDYAQANSAGEHTDGRTKIYHEDDCAFAVAPLHQDVNDYMMDVTDEKLLGAVYLTSDKGPQARPDEDDEFASATTRWVMTYDFENGDWVHETEPKFMGHKSSAVALERVEGADTYNNVAFNEAGGKYYATFYSPYPVARPEGVATYYVTETHETAGDYYLHMEEVESPVVQAGFPVIFVSPTDKSSEYLHMGLYTQEMKELVEGRIGQKGDNLLQGTRDDVLTSNAVTVEGGPGQVYVLNKKSGVVGFYRYIGDKLPVGKAYYVHPEGEAAPAGIRGFMFFDNAGVATRIDLDPMATHAAEAYDLSGRRVDGAGRGLYIVGGRKVAK